MKKGLIKLLTISSAALLMLPSCKKSDVKVTADPNKQGTLSASSTTIVLDKTRLADTTAAITFNFQAPNLGFANGTVYTIQIDSAGDNWKKPTSVTLATGVTKQGYSTADFNAMILKLNLKAGVASAVNVRVQQQLSNTVVSYSNTLSLTVTPFNLASWLYITGNFSGWQNPGAKEDSLESATSNGVYSGIINFVTPQAPGDDEFLILPVKGSWSHKYATTDPQHTTSKTVTYDASNNLFAPGEGYYMVTFDLNKGTITFQQVDYYSVTGNEVVGGDWGVDQFMKYVNDGSNTWTATLNMAPVSGGGFKVRQDAAWSNSWGIPQTGSTGFGQTGVLASDKDGNLSVTTAGNYTTTITVAPSNLGSAPTVVIPYTFNGH